MDAVRNWLDSRFALSRHGTTVRTELLAGLTTFLTMSYIIFVNPIILSAAKMDPGAVMVATCVGSAVGTFLMGLLANYPIAMAPGMGHNAFFAFIICGTMGFTFQQALAANLISGTLFLVLVLAGLSNSFIESVPNSLKHAIAVGIGLLLAMIGLQWGGLIAPHPATLVTLGDLTSPSVLITLVGFIVMSVLLLLKVRGAIILGLLAGLVVALLFQIARFEGKIVDRPPSVAPTFLAFDFPGLTKHLGDLIAVVFFILLLDNFDNLGNQIGVAAT
ncbi:MAG: NCS2 family permease, partial [Armatimonadota bacterium]|nr:NCS2 family permease [Armatimonadota bacterium]